MQVPPSTSLVWFLVSAELDGNEAFLGVPSCALKGKVFLSPHLANGLDQGERQLSGSFHATGSDRN